MIQQRVAFEAPAAVEVDGDRATAAVARQRHRSGRAEHHAPAEPGAMTGVVLDDVADHTAGEGQRPVQRVLGSRLELGRRLPLPLRVGVGGIDRVRAATRGRVAADRFMQPGHRVGGVDGAQQVLQHVGVVDADVQQDAAVLAAVPPQADQHPVAAAHAVLNDQPRRADHAGIQQRTGQPAHRVAAVVLGHAEDGRGCRRRVADSPARGHGRRHRLLDQDVQSALQRLHRHDVVRARNAGDVHRLHAVGMQIPERRHHGRPRAEGRLRFIRERCRVRLHRVAGCDQIQR